MLYVSHHSLFFGNLLVSTRVEYVRVVVTY